MLFIDWSPENSTLCERSAYPFQLVLILVMWILKLIFKSVDHFVKKYKDEKYLIRVELSNANVN